jgi:glutamine transport system substrate-binding protein
MALISGNVDATFYDVPNVMYFIKTKGKGKIKAVGPIYAGQKYGIAFPKGSHWVKPVDKALAAIKKDGTFAKIYKKWFDKAPPADLTQ